MALLKPQPSARPFPNRDLRFEIAAFFVPACTYIFTASPAAFWLDSGEFVAAAAHFGISHPPGHPSQSLVSVLAMLFPFGPVSFRVAIVSAICSSLASLMIFRAGQDIFRRIVASNLVYSPLALAAAWASAASPSWWFQSIRPEVYALQVLLLAFILRQLTRLDFAEGRRDLRPLFAAAFVFGFALGNHHFLTLLLLPVAALVLGDCVREHGKRAFIGTTLASIWGALVFVLLPIRASAGAALNLGNPNSFTRFFWLVSAKAFQKNQGQSVPGTIVSRSFDVLAAFVDNTTWVVIGLALVATYATMRTNTLRRGGRLWIITLVIFVVARIWLGFVSGNPDAQGYLMIAVAAVMLLAALAVALIISLIGQHNRVRKFAGISLAWVCLLAAGLHFAQNARSTSLAHFYDTDTFDEVLQRELPQDAIVVAFGPETIFRIWGNYAEEGERDDLTLIPTPLLAYPGMVPSLVDKQEELGGLLHRFLMTNQFDPGELQSLTATRPVLVELDLRLPPSHYEFLRPNGLFFEVSAGRVSRADIAHSMKSAKKSWAFVNRFSEGMNQHTRNQILWRRYMQALYLTHHAFYKDALEAIRAGLLINPNARELLALRKAIEQAGERRIDIRAFFVDATH